MNKDSGLRLERVLVDGAMTGNALMMQTLADFLSEFPHEQTQFVLRNLLSFITFRIIRLKLTVMLSHRQEQEGQQEVKPSNLGPAF